jgi:hypothetical protein
MKIKVVFGATHRINIILEMKQYDSEIWRRVGHKSGCWIMDLMYYLNFVCEWLLPQPIL